MRHSVPAVVLLAAALALGAGACGSDPTGDPGLPEPGDSIIVAFDQSLAGWPRDGWDLLARSVNDSTLHLSVAYGGGCADHDLWLLAVDGFGDIYDAGVTPTVVVPLFLAHDAHDDPCDMYVNSSLDFDLTPLLNAFREQVGTGPARILLRIPAGQGSLDSATVDFTFE